MNDVDKILRKKRGGQFKGQKLTNYEIIMVSASWKDECDYRLWNQIPQFLYGLNLFLSVII